HARGWRQDCPLRVPSTRSVRRAAFAYSWSRGTDREGEDADRSVGRTPASTRSFTWRSADGLLKKSRNRLLPRSLQQMLPLPDEEQVCRGENNTRRGRSSQSTLQ